MAPGPHRQVFVDGVNFRPLNAGLKCFERARLQPCRNDQQKEKKGTGFSPYIRPTSSPVIHRLGHPRKRGWPRRRTSICLCDAQSTTKMGAPRLDFETWETTTLNRTEGTAAPGPHRQVFVDGMNFRPLNARAQ